jgi:hypothetical protein
MLLFAWGYGSLFVTPIYASLFGTYPWLSRFELFWLALLRGIASRHLRRSLLEIFTTPIAAWGVMALAISTLFRRLVGQKVNWKGRYYSG